MAEKISNIVKNLISAMHSISQTETILGEPTQVGSATVIPELMSKRLHRLVDRLEPAAAKAGLSTPPRTCGGAPSPQTWLCAQSPHAASRRTFPEGQLREHLTRRRPESL